MKKFMCKLGDGSSIYYYGRSKNPDNKVEHCYRLVDPSGMETCFYINPTDNLCMDGRYLTGSYVGVPDGFLGNLGSVTLRDGRGKFENFDVVDDDNDVIDANKYAGKTLYVKFPRLSKIMRNPELVYRSLQYSYSIGCGYDLLSIIRIHSHHFGIGVFFESLFFYATKECKYTIK